MRLMLLRECLKTSNDFIFKVTNKRRGGKIHTSGLHPVSIRSALPLASGPPVLPSEVKPKGNLQVEQYVSKIKASCSEVLTFVTSVTIVTDGKGDWFIRAHCHHLALPGNPHFVYTCAHRVRLEQPTERMRNRKRHR